MTNHDLLVSVARRWLTKRCPVVCTELVTQGWESADALGFASDGGTILIECKASRADFLADRKKGFRLMPELGMGARRYFLALTGLIKPEELPEGWGLLSVNGRSVRMMVESKYFRERNHDGERVVLVSLLRRLGIPERKGVNITCYAYDFPTKRKATLSIAKHEQEVSEL
jgi:hypothetical protein